MSLVLHVCRGLTVTTLVYRQQRIYLGKVRYIGFSDTHALKVSRAQTISDFREWAPLIALQIEYSLLERSVEGELMPMAQALGLGVSGQSRATLPRKHSGSSTC